MVLQKHEMSFSQWQDKFSKEINVIFNNLESFLRNLHLNDEDYVIKPFNTDDLKAEFLLVLYKNSYNRFTTYNFLK